MIKVYQRGKKKVLGTGTATATGRAFRFKVKIKLIAAALKLIAKKRSGAQFNLRATLTRDSGASAQASGRTVATRR